MTEVNGARRRIQRHHTVEVMYLGQSRSRSGHIYTASSATDIN